MKAEEFWGNIRAFRTEFRANAPFNPPHDEDGGGMTVDEAYTAMDGFAHNLKRMTTGASRLNEQKELFELQVR